MTDDIKKEKIDDKEHSHKKKESSSRSLCGCLAVDPCGCYTDPCGFVADPCACSPDPCGCGMIEESGRYESSCGCINFR